MKKRTVIQVLFTSAIFSLPMFAASANFCPQQITCNVTIIKDHNSANCPVLPGSWSISAVMTSGSIFNPGSYQFSFSQAQSFPSTSTSSNCTYITKSKDTTAEIALTISSPSWIATTTIANKWQNGIQVEKYCFHDGMWYDKINNASACPFVTRQ